VCCTHGLIAEGLRGLGQGLGTTHGGKGKGQELLHGGTELRLKKGRGMERVNHWIE